MKQPQNAEVRTSSHFLRNLIIIFLSALLVLGIVLGAISLARSKNTYARYGGAIADKATYSYLLSYYKFNHMIELTKAGVKGAEDTEAFWSSVDTASGKTHGELLSEGAKNYVSRVLISASLFDSNATAAQKRAAKEAAKKAKEELLTYRANGDAKAFDEMVAPFGYSSKDLEKIALLLYKAENAQSMFYGSGGETVSTRLSECNLYLNENYSAVYLFFIRDETTFETTEDEDGNQTIVRNDYGNPVMRELYLSETIEREQIIADIDASIAQSSLTEDWFIDKMKGHYEKAPEGSATIYYLASGTTYTETFKKSVSENIVATAEAMAIGDCKKVAYDHGVCYVYKVTPQAGAFSATGNEDFFSDFYENVANYLFPIDIATFKADVVFTERSAEIAVTALPYKNFIPVRF